MLAYRHLVITVPSLKEKQRIASLSVPFEHVERKRAGRTRTTPPVLGHLLDDLLYRDQEGKHCDFDRSTSCILGGQVQWLTGT